jgi:transposase-like protein
MTEQKSAVLDAAADDELASDVIDDELVDRLLAQADADGAELLGPEGLLTDLTRRVLERALDEELTAHLGYERGDPAGRGSGNSRNGSTPKTLLTDAGAVGLDVPRDRAGTFDPKIVPKGSRRLDGFNDMVLSLVANGMTMRDVQAHLFDIYGVEVSPELISKITESVWDELVEWQNRPLDRMYPILYVDALTVKVRDGGIVARRPAYLSVGVDVEGRKHILGVWLGDGGEGASFWLGVLTELRHRGVDDVLIACCDGLPGLAEALEATWPQVVVQTCVVHLIRGSLRYASWKDRKLITAALKPIYTAVNVTAAEQAMDDFEKTYGDRYGGIVKLWRDTWDRFVPFLDYPPEIRRVVYTTNMIESINFQMRKATRQRGSFPNDRSAIKFLYLAIKRISTQRGGEHGTGTWGWTRALNAFAIHFPGRITID